MTAISITAAQIKRLQVLYHQYERHSLDAGPSREERMAWASDRAGRKISSFSDLTGDEASRMIDHLQGILGVRVPSKSPQRRRPTRRDGQKAGTEGRHDQIHDEATLVGPRDLQRIQRDITRLGWDQPRLEAFLASKRGPNDGRTTILTLGDANRIHWALKRMNPDQKGVQTIAK